MKGVVESVTSWVNAGLAFFYPEVCQLCNEVRATAREGFVCSACRAHVCYIERPFCERCGFPYPGAISNEFECGNCRGMDLHFRAARSAVAAQDKVLEVIHKYKYHRAIWFEPFLVELLVKRAAPELRAADWDYIVPVPLHPVKLREREFNQAERLATPLSAATGIPVNKRLLRRILPTRTQTKLSREERAANVRKAFTLQKAGSLEGRRIVLVDDVFTTGATTNACARVLCEAGACEVCVWTVARGT